MTNIDNLPIAKHLEKIYTTLKNSSCHSLVLTAETGAGKSTAVPGVLLKHFTGKILMLEPRRLAVLAVAQRTALQLAEQPGETVGYRMHLNSKISEKTRLEIMTEAILTRKLLADPLLEDTNVIIIDEFHERSLQSDLSLAFLKQTMQLRDDLYILVMSATIDTEKIAAYLGSPADPAPVYHVPGRLFPVKTVYKGNISPSLAVIQELNNPSAKNRDGILVFLPGIYDIRKCFSELESYKEEADIFILHSSIKFEEQKKILQEPKTDDKRRVILSSAIAETSLTVPAISIVIDSGLSRISRYSPRTGMQHLETEMESSFSAAQRSGRAGRLGPGTCICLWNINEPRISSTPPEILRSDLSELVLTCYIWGSSKLQSFSWIDSPSKVLWETSEKFLLQTGCIEQGKITAYGKAVLSLGIEPRLACTALTGFFYTDSDALQESLKTALSFSSYKDASPALKAKYTAQIEKRIHLCSRYLKTNKKKQISATFPITTAALLAGFPDRLAKLCDSEIYQFPSGHTARLLLTENKKNNTFPEWIIAPEVDEGDFLGKIYAFEPVSSATIASWLSKHSTIISKIEVIKNSDTKESFIKFNKTETLCFGKIVLSQKKKKPQLFEIKKELTAVVHQKGFSFLPLSNKTKDLLLRTTFFIQQQNIAHINNCVIESPSENKLVKQIDLWLFPFLTETTTKINEQIIYDALYWFLPGTIIDKNVPKEIQLENGKKAKLQYQLRTRTETDSEQEIIPILKIIIQRLFGCFTSPEVMGKTVLLTLLSPAQRPLQITDNLEAFWKTTWPDICKEMKGRYPKHNWNYKISEK